ncbi:MAG: hypothetical protein WCC57_08310, partial [Paracoccaceae bacterium]
MASTPSGQTDLIAALALDEATSFADIGGTALPLALAAWLKWECTITLIDQDRKGDFPDPPSPWVQPYIQSLQDAGVPADRIIPVHSATDLHPYDVIANLNGYGDQHKIKHFETVLTRCLHSETRILTDIRKGSGAYPFLKDYGTLNALSDHDDHGTKITRLLMRATAPSAPTADDGSWASIAATLAGPDGFFRDNGMHSFLHIPRGNTLVVTFDNLDIAMTKRDDRRPWGFSFIEKQGWSMLGVMANGWTWYRDPWVWDQFDTLAATGYFKQFKRVVFYGASMGGYAACAFVAACPGADVLAISPQSTLDKTLVPWETRYHTAWDRDFSGKYGDATTASHAASRVTLLYDPYEPLDAGHANRFTHPNVTKLRTP